LNVPDVAGYFTPARVAVIEAVVTTRHAATAVAVRAAQLGD